MRADPPEPSTLPHPSDPDRATVAVLARSSWPATRPALAAAEHLGALLAGHGLTVATTGYGDLVAAVSRGVALAGGCSVGFPVRTWRAEPTAWLTEVRWVPDSYAQCAALGAHPAIVTLGPSPGSLAEAAFAWQIAGRRAELVLVGEDWHHWLAALWRWLVPRRSDLSTVAVVDEVTDVVPRLERALAGRSDGGARLGSAGPGVASGEGSTAG
ncbi:MAG TPA: hypothetical protein VNO86_06940 [Candidatus Binatia bacterium]|nr:hypothetical protein [Candidatus Binatia bacterium]